MRITSIMFGESTIPLKQPFVTALRQVEHLESIIVRIETESGRIGYGETAPTEAITGESKRSILSALRRGRESLLGEDLENLNTVLTKMHATIDGHPNARSAIDGHPNARSAMEIALYDLAAQAAGVPLVTYLG